MKHWQGIQGATIGESVSFKNKMILFFFNLNYINIISQLYSFMPYINVLYVK